MRFLGVFAFAVVATMVGASGLASAGILSDLTSGSSSSSSSASYSQRVNLDSGNVLAAIALGAGRDRSFSSAAFPLTGDLSGYSIRGEFIANAAIARGTLYRVDARDSVLAASTVSRSDLANASIVSSAISQTDLVRGVVSDSRLTRSTIDGTQVMGSRLFDVTGVNAAIADSVIEKSELAGTTITNSRIWGSDLMDSNVTGGSIERTRMDQATFLRIDPTTTALCRVEVAGVAQTITTRCV